MGMNKSTLLFLLVLGNPVPDLLADGSGDWTCKLNRVKRAQEIIGFSRGLD